LAEAKDLTGKDAHQRFAEIRGFFLERLGQSGQARAELYFRAKPGDAREPTEEEVVRKWSEKTWVSVNDIYIGIHRAFEAATKCGQVIATFRNCEPFVAGRVKELSDSRAEQWG